MYIHTYNHENYICDTTLSKEVDGERGKKQSGGREGVKSRAVAENRTHITLPLPLPQSLLLPCPPTRSAQTNTFALLVFSFC